MHDEKDEAAHLCDCNRNATSVCQEGHAAARANKYDLTRLCACNDERVVARSCAYDGEDDSVPFRKRDSSAKNTLRDGS